jgi:hypothetical protein
MQLEVKKATTSHQDPTGDKAGDWGAKQVGATIKVYDACARVQEERQLRQRAQQGSIMRERGCVHLAER